MTDDNIDTIRQRVAKLERENRRYKLANMVIISILILMI